MIWPIIVPPKHLGADFWRLSYADDSYLMADAPTPAVKVTEAESMKSDLGKVVSGVTFGGLNSMRVILRL